MSEDLMLDVGQANELKMAFRRAGYTSHEVKCLSAGDMLADVLKVMRGDAKIISDRITFEIIGTGITSHQWIDRLTTGGYRLTDWARDILSKPDYDAKHRLECGKVYKVVLVRGNEIRKDNERTTKNLKAFATRELGEESVAGLKAELALLIREKFTNAELEAMGLSYITVLHEPIVDSDGNPRVLFSRRHEFELLVVAYHTCLGGLWDEDGAFAFFANQTVAVSKEVLSEVDAAMFNSQEYFTTRDGLYILSEFTSRILPAYITPIVKRGIEGVESVDLTRNKYDRELIAEYLGGEEEARKNAFTLDQIAAMIDAQKGGVDGALLNNGVTNIFYVIGKDGVLCGVRVFWAFFDSQYWGVDAYKLVKGVNTNAGPRLFYNKH